MWGKVAFCRAPLCPAGHLPHEGGWMSRWLSPIANVEERALSVKLPISPQVGEMSGRTEGGATERDRRKLAACAT
ncbi:MAG: hypothetical protein EOR92_28220 [Mesorhizobium sp.]|nr:MAG: hypothetical protein EOR02_26675 [Mesorhizobium sp.]RWP57243.1 MAG: hypothetical protein EOR07_31635 [Mesorhizobium sp.]RWQ13916.1 MAG: hypothetical protein EOR92_28220 [Mesorhizobium sp.]